MNAQLAAVSAHQAVTDTAHSEWKSLYKIGCAAAFLSLVFYPIQIAVFMITPPPATITGWFQLLRENLFFGLVDLDLLLVVDEVLAMLIFFTLYIALRRINQSFMAVGVLFGLVATILFISSNPALAMLSLSGQFSAAVTAGEREWILAAGQAVMSSWQGSAAQTGYILGSIAPILMSIVMLRSKVFGKAAAYMGILSNVIAFGLYVPVIGVYISVFSVVFLWVWVLLVAIGFYKLGWTGRENV